MARDKRRLAAILAADIVGYSRLMGADESGTLAQLKTHRKELIDPKVEEYGGRIVKTSGDGILMEFPSVLDAVQLAVEMQRGMAERNARVPEDLRIEFRVGINLGDIIVDGDDIYGDGVNIAARLEGIAEPGGICISRRVHEDVSDKLDLQFEDLGEKKLKNIARPVQVFSVALASDTRPSPTDSTPLPLPDKPSIAVLPFDNMSGDPEQDYFSDGISEDIITSLSKYPELFVIARNSSFTFRGQAVDIGEVSKTLGVRNVLEGSVRKVGNRVRITAQLVDGATGGHLWAEKYDRNLDDIFAVQDEVTKEIVGALAPKLMGKSTKARRPDTENIAAYDYVLRGREFVFQETKIGNQKALELFEKAVELDPNYASAKAYLAAACLQKMEWSDDPMAELARAMELASEAVSLDDSLPPAHFVLSAVLLWQKRHDEALEEAELAVKLDPNDADNVAGAATVLTWAGRPSDAFDMLEKALRLNPNHPFSYLFGLGHVHFLEKRYEQAINAFDRCIRINPDAMAPYIFLAASQEYLGDMEGARHNISMARQRDLKYTLAMARQMLPYRHQEDLDHLLNALSRAGYEA